ncbi:hypothetical protein XENOCAPTIV_027853, partial [Xenoophorus captivus]
QESAKAKNQKEVIKTLKELKLHVPADKKQNCRSTTLSALKHALRCVKQVEGKVIYISDQAASILNCKRDTFKDSKFVEFLMPQDISVFYSFTTPYRLPSWSMCTGAGTKSCRSLCRLIV